MRIRQRHKFLLIAMIALGLIALMNLFILVTLLRRPETKPIGTALSSSLPQVPLLAMIVWLLIAAALALFVLTRMRQAQWQPDMNECWVIFGGISILWWILAGQFTIAGS